MKGFSYVITRDYGFAPNPFGGYCTLATCKPVIRRIAYPGDIIFGYSPKSDGNKLILAMKVTERISFNDYWNDPRFQYKKPVFNGSLVRTFGDNIYFFDGDTWHQADSHHSLEDGNENYINLRRDTKSDSVLISTEYFYFGIDRIILPEQVKPEANITRGHRTVSEANATIIWDWLCEHFRINYIGDPTLLKNGFVRYNGL